MQPIQQKKQQNFIINLKKDDDLNKLQLQDNQLPLYILRNKKEISQSHSNVLHYQLLFSKENVFRAIQNCEACRKIMLACSNDINNYIKTFNIANRNAIEIRLPTADEEIDCSCEYYCDSGDFKKMYNAAYTNLYGNEKPTDKNRNDREAACIDEINQNIHKYTQYLGTTRKQLPEYLQ